MTANNTNDSNYSQKIAEIAAFTKAHKGPIFIAAHEDPDGDAIGLTVITQSIFQERQ